MDIQIIITDIDGVWTDGGMYYTESGDEYKKFNTTDSVGVILAKAAGIKLIIMTGEESNCVKNRAKKLNIDNCYLGVKDKLNLAKEIALREGVSLQQIAFIGDEVNDHKLLKETGFSACPQSAPEYTKKIVSFVVPTDGGKGAFRDFVFEILRRKNIFKELFDQLTNG